MTGTSNISNYKDGGYSVTRIKFSNGASMSFRKVKNSSSGKKLKPKYNYKLLSAAILRAKTPNGASQAAMKARQKLGELLRGSRSGEDSDPDLKAAILHVRKMELIAKRKKKHLEQEKIAERGQASCGEDDDWMKDAAGGLEAERESSEKQGAELEQEEARLAEEMEQLQREMTEKMLDELSDLSEELMENSEKLQEEMSEAEGILNVTDMSPDDIKELKRKHRNEEWRDITRADMDFLKAKFYRLQQEKTAAGSKGAFENPGTVGTNSSFAADISMDISIDSAMDMNFPASDIGAVIDTTV